MQAQTVFCVICSLRDLTLVLTKTMATLVLHGIVAWRDRTLRATLSIRAFNAVRILHGRLKPKERCTVRAARHGHVCRHAHMHELLAATAAASSDKQSLIKNIEDRKTQLHGGKHVATVNTVHVQLLVL